MPRLKPDNSEERAQLEGAVEALEALTSFIEVCDNNNFSDELTLSIVKSIISDMQEKAEEKKESL